ncbi:hypothetical protein B0A54_13600 [Friedmanniomyces endolithicus]|uniref:Protein CASP n=1 Tax=Friedmanniomyces endolithicus TaxID=329885 RepID=A0A4U0UIT2_9PEZI|nr:hypothetical protein B0A54_13600 [Friedmanniomyces endolithicus]
MAETTDLPTAAGATKPNGMTTTTTTTITATDSPADQLNGRGSNKFQQAIAAWRSLDFSHLISTLDTTASDLVAHQHDSLVQRKELAQKTKDFRKLDDGSKLGEIKDLLKAYQSYIDAITTHSKTVQTAFMQAYSPLSDAPDPYPLLEASIDSLVTADEVVPQLEAENEHLQQQVTKLNGQLEESERQLEDERTKRQTFEGAQDSRIQEVEGSWLAVLKEKEENWTAKEHNLEEKVENQERLLKELKASYEVSQRLERSDEDAQDLGRGTATQAELDIVNSELERSNVRSADLEARNEQLRIELAQSAGQAHTSGRNTAVEDDPAYLRLRSENQTLLRRLDSARHEKNSEKSGVESKLRSLEREIGALKSDRDGLQARVQKWSDYDEVKRELEMLRAIEFSTVDDDNDDDDEQANEHSNGTTSDTLEQLLLARNKKVTADLTELRVAHNDLLQQLETLQHDLVTTQTGLESSQRLNATLENDLQKTQQEASNAVETMSVAGTWTSRYPANNRSMYGSRRGGGGTSPTSSIIGGFDPTSYSGSGSPRGGGGTLETLRAGEAAAMGPGGSTGILPMVTAQRDRFKKKISELESELQKQYQSVAGLRSEVAGLQKDNLNLYEKTRYVSTYNSNSTAHSRAQQQQQATSGASYGGNMNPGTISIGSPVAEDRYRSAYEQNLSPFAAFRGRESARARKRMSLPERAVFQLTRLVLATRTSRNLFAMYCMGLHVLVFVMLFWAGLGDVEKHASRLGAAAGAAVVGAGVGVGGTEHGGWREEGLGAAAGG